MEGGYYEKGNLEIQSSDYRKHTDCYCDHPRSDKLFRCIKQARPLTPTLPPGGGRERRAVGEWLSAVGATFERAVRKGCQYERYMVKGAL